jgi:hypothetical protein
MAASKLVFQKIQEAAKLHGRNFASGFGAECPGGAPYERTGAHERGR